MPDIFPHQGVNTFVIYVGQSEAICKTLKIYIIAELGVIRKGWTLNDGLAANFETRHCYHSPAICKVATFSKGFVLHYRQ